MERESPAWQPYDPGEPGPELPLSRPGDDGPARVVVLLTTAAASRDGWAARAGVRLVRDLASNDGRTVLADLGLRTPRLHEELGVPNHEGVSDVFLWGASFQRVAHAVEPGLLFAPAGTVVADPAAVAGSPRWEAVLDGARRAGATLVLYVPDDAPGLHHLLDRSSDIVVLAVREEADALALGDWGPRVRAILGPETSGVVAGVAGGASAAGPAESPASDAGDEALSGAAGASALGDEPAGTKGVDDLDPGWEEEISRAVASAKSRRFRPAVWIVLGLVLLAAVVLAAWGGWVDVPYLTPFLAGPTEVVDPPATAGDATPDPPAAEAQPPAREETVGAEAPTTPVSQAGAPFQRFSLQLGAYALADSAVANAEILAARHPGVPFMVAPVEVDGRVFHRLLAGLAEDPAGVARLRGSLEGAPGVAGALDRAAGWAFLLAELDVLEEARVRAQEMASGAVQPYVLEVSGPEGTVYRVYAGAYAGEAEAATLAALLVEQGRGDAPLVRRVGRLPG